MGCQPHISGGGSCLRHLGFGAPPRARRSRRTRRRPASPAVTAAAHHLDAYAWDKAGRDRRTESTHGGTNRRGDTHVVDVAAGHGHGHGARQLHRGMCAPPRPLASRSGAVRTGVAHEQPVQVADGPRDGTGVSTLQDQQHVGRDPARGRTVIVPRRSRGSPMTLKSGSTVAAQALGDHQLGIARSLAGTGHTSGSAHGARTDPRRTRARPRLGRCLRTSRPHRHRRRDVLRRRVGARVPAAAFRRPVLSLTQPCPAPDSIRHGSTFICSRCVSHWWPAPCACSTAASRTARRCGTSPSTTRRRHWLRWPGSTALFAPYASLLPPRSAALTGGGTVPRSRMTSRGAFRACGARPGGSFPPHRALY